MVKKEGDGVDFQLKMFLGRKSFVAFIFLIIFVLLTLSGLSSAEMWNFLRRLSFLF
jgi:hypothetical protein